MPANYVFLWINISSNHPGKETTYIYINAFPQKQNTQMKKLYEKKRNKKERNEKKANWQFDSLNKTR